MSSLGNKQIMSSNITYYMNKFGKTRSEVCEALGVKYTTFTDWIKGNTYPRIDKIELMANYFGISKSDLVEERTANETFSNQKTINTTDFLYALDENICILIETYKSLSDENKKHLFEYAKNLKKIDNIS